MFCNLISGELESSDDEIYGSSAHSDYGMVTLLATDGVQGLQACLLLISCSVHPYFLFSLTAVN